MPLDEKLLNKQSAANKDEESSADESAERAGALREAQNNQGGGNQEVDGSLRSRVMAVKKEKQKTARGMLADQEKSLSTGTSKVLQSAWRSLIPSWGFSFLYVYVHLFLQAIFGKKLFAPLGSEWFDRPGISVKKRDEMGEKVHLAETMGVGCCTIVIFILIITIFAIIALLLEVVENPIATIAEVGWSWIKNAFSKFLGD